MTRTSALFAAVFVAALALSAFVPAYAMCCGGKEAGAKATKKCMPGMEKSAATPRGSATERGSTTERGAATENQSQPPASGRGNDEHANHRGSTSSHTGGAGKSGCCCCCGKKS